MLGYNYITIEGVKIPNPIEPEKSYSHIEKVKQAEDGGDVVLTTRTNKRVYTLPFNLTDEWLERLLRLSQKPLVTMTWNGEQIRGRFRADKDSLVNGSEFIRGTNGLYQATFKFYER